MFCMSFKGKHKIRGANQDCVNTFLVKGLLVMYRQIRLPTVGSRAGRGMGALANKGNSCGSFLWPSGHASVVQNLALVLGACPFSLASLPAKCRV